MQRVHVPHRTQPRASHHPHFALPSSQQCPRQLASGHGVGYGSPSPVSPNASAALAAALAVIQANMTAKLAELNAPSAVLIVVQNGAVLHESYVGTTQIGGGGGAPTRDSGYRIASNTKVFTSLMLYQLRDKGLLPQGLDTPVAAVLPGWVEPVAARPGTGGVASRRPLTLRSLATQSSGLVREHPQLANETAILAAIGRLELLHPMYATTHYSNLGLALLGRALEKVSAKAGLGATWEAYVHGACVCVCVCVCVCGEERMWA